MKAGTESAGYRINFISVNRVLTEKVKSHAGRRKDLLFVFSDDPESEEVTDAYIIPVEKLNLLRLYLKKTGLPVLVYGSPLFLKKAFLLGGADFLKDPWTIDELLLRLDKVLKEHNSRNSFEWGCLELVNDTLCCGQRSVPLSHQEYLILKTLLMNRDSVVSRASLLSRIWNTLEDRQSRVVDMHVSKLRKKIVKVLPDGLKKQQIIKSVRGKGYAII
ncbi:MAG: response regulator transcription factor [Spirochaetales bacterium]|nr:response regulator transcription factor [Spirochaetales bacterium]